MKPSTQRARQKIRDRRNGVKTWPSYQQVTQKLEDDYENITGHKMYCSAGFNDQCQCGARPDLESKEGYGKQK